MVHGQTVAGSFCSNPAGGTALGNQGFLTPVSSAETGQNPLYFPESLDSSLLYGLMTARHNRRSLGRAGRGSKEWTKWNGFGAGRSSAWWL